MNETCVHGEAKPHFILTVEPSYLEPAPCGGSPANWFVYEAATKLHRWGCKGNAGSMVVEWQMPLRLADDEQLAVLPIGLCCRVDRVQRFARSFGEDTE